MKPKILTDEHMAAAILLVVKHNMIKDNGQYKEFLDDIGNVIVNHFGGIKGQIEEPVPGLEQFNLKTNQWQMPFYWADDTQKWEDFWKCFDTEISLKEWKESFEENYGNN